MHYQFPVIRTIDDVLPHIKDRPEFIVAEKGDYKVINYMVSMADTFKMNGADDIGGAIRRECRGLIFWADGNLMSRPFHKYFNVMENEETQLHNIDIGRPHIVMEKVDGSMIRLIHTGGKYRLATKMGVTDTSIEAEKVITRDQMDWLIDSFERAETALLEYIAPTNKIVVAYDTPQLIMLGVRNNLKGTYTSHVQSPFELVKMYGSLDGSLDGYIRTARQQQGREGDVIRFDDGMMLKIKNDWYVRIHKTKDLIRTERNIADIIVNEQLDDILPILDSVDLKTVREFERRFDSAIDNVVGRIEGLVMVAKTVYGGDKKRVALEFVPNLINKEDSSFIFSALDGKPIRPLVIAKIKGSVGNGPKFESMMNWMEG